MLQVCMCYNVLILLQVDYKGCRDLLRVVLDKAMHVPPKDNVSCLAAIQSVQQVLHSCARFVRSKQFRKFENKIYWFLFTEAGIKFEMYIV